MRQDTINQRSRLDVTPSSSAECLKERERWCQPRTGPIGQRKVVIGSFVNCLNDCKKRLAKTVIEIGQDYVNGVLGCTVCSNSCVASPVLSSVNVTASVAKAPPACSGPIKVATMPWLNGVLTKWSVCNRARACQATLAAAGPSRVAQSRY